MKKLLLLLFTVLSLSVAKAEDVIQVLPFATTAGVSTPTNIAVNMVNTRVYIGLEFSIYVPEGMTLVKGALSDRFKHYDDGEDDYIKTHSLEVTDKGSDLEKGHKYYVTCYDAGLNPIKDEEGRLFYLKYTTSADMQPGVYPIIIEGTVLGIDGNTGVNPATSVSYVKIGTPAANTISNLGGTTVQQLLVPSFVQTALNEENNVVVNGTCANFVLTDGADFSLPCNFTATNATYSRAMDTEWGTVCLPYEVKSNDQVEYYNITGIEGNVLTLEKLNTLSANTPALMKKLSGTGVTCSASNVGVASTGLLSGKMVGSYAQNTKIEDADAYYIRDNKFWKNNGHFFIDAFRAYFKASTTGAKPSQLSIGEISTAINALTSEEGVVGVYDANGMKKGSVGNGMNIIKMADGKCVKVFVK